MIEIKELSSYSKEAGENIRNLLIQLSRSGRDPGETSQELVEEIINSPFHTLIVAEEDGKILGMATVSIVMGMGIQKNIYLEDFVVAEETRGKGVGGMLWDSIIAWGKSHGCNNLEFTSGKDRTNALAFYAEHGAEIYDTNFFRKKLAE